MGFVVPPPAASPQVRDASLLRFLVDMRDADLEAKQMRDDLMTMLIAGACRSVLAGGLALRLHLQLLMSAACCLCCASGSRLCLSPSWVVATACCWGRWRFHLPQR
jgi:hypothetical protein